MFDSFRQSFGLSPTKQSLTLPVIDVDSDAETEGDCTTSQETSDPSVWGYLDVESRKGKITGGLPIMDRNFTIGR